MTLATLSVTAEPTVAGVLRYLPLAPAKAGEQAMCQVNLVMRIANAGPDPARVMQVRLVVPGSPTGEVPFDVDITVPAGGSRRWTQTADFLTVIVEEPKLRIRLEVDGLATDPQFLLPLAPHASPGPGGVYGFWARADDLRAEEFWAINGTAHSQDGPQIFAYDVGVAKRKGDGSGAYDALLPGTDGSLNEHFRIWGQPIRAVADGVVVAFRDDYPGNAVPGQIDIAAQAWFQGGPAVDGNGNFFCIDGGGETVLYAHLQAGTLNRALLAPETPVKAGDFLGLAGNSGASGAPHLHIHAVRSGSGNHPWTGDPRPMLFDKLHAVLFGALPANVAQAPWAAVQRRGFPPGDCAVWPGDSPPPERIPCLLTDFTLTPQGRPWVVRGDGAVRTTNAWLPARGVYLGVNPGGTAKAIAVHGTTPYVVGSNDRVWEGKPDGWVTMPASPLATRVAVDATTGRPWALRTDGRVFRSSASAWTESTGGMKAHDLCLVGGVPHVVSRADDRVWKHDGANDWQASFGQQTAVRLTADPASGTLWVLTADGRVLRHAGGTVWSDYVEVPGTDAAHGRVSLAIAVADGRPVVIGPDRQLWIGSAGWGWQRVRLTTPR